MLRSVAGGVVMLLACVGNSSCGSPTAPATAQQPPSAMGLVVTDMSIAASLERWASAPWDISYTFCYTMEAASPDVVNMTFRRVDYTTIGPTGDAYNTSSDPSLGGEPVGLRRSGCFFTYRDQNITRPVATMYRLSFEYAVDNGTQPTTQIVSGNISSDVPPQPFVTSVTLTHDIQGVQMILRQPTPVTFTVSKVEGGTPPFLYRWRLNGFLLRDWDPNPVLIWDGMTLGGRPVISGGYTLAVGVRRSTWPTSESGAQLSFLVSPVTDRIVGPSGS